MCHSKEKRNNSYFYTKSIKSLAKVKCTCTCVEEFLFRECKEGDIYRKRICRNVVRWQQWKEILNCYSFVVVFYLFFFFLENFCNLSVQFCFYYKCCIWKRLCVRVCVCVCLEP